MLASVQVSVIVICRNARLFIEACLASISAQTCPVDEVIVIDGHSTDGTWEWLLTQSGLTLYRQTGRGIGNARNEGLAMASGDWVAFLDADDRWLPHKNALQIQWLEANPSDQMVTGYLQKTGETRQYIALTPSGCMMRRGVFEVVGIFDENLKVAADHEWFMRIKKHKIQVGTVPQLIMYKTLHGANMSVTKQDIYRLELLQLLKSKQNTNGVQD
jgi:glycosyltransferase involved in cell wall biosynthesis